MCFIQIDSLMLALRAALMDRRCTESTRVDSQVRMEETGVEGWIPHSSFREKRTQKQTEDSADAVRRCSVDTWHRS